MIAELEEVEEISLAKAGMRKSRRLMLGGIAALVLAGGAAAWALYASGYQSTDDAEVDGHLNVVSARIGGTTAAVYVNDNQIVEVGQPLVDLDPSEQKVVYNQAKAQYDQAVAQLNAERPSVAITQAENAASAVTSDVQVAEARAAYAAASQDLAGAAAKLAEAEAVRLRDDADLQRYDELYKAGTVSRQEYERAVAAAHSGDASANAAKANVESAGQVLEERKVEIDAQRAHREQVVRTAPGQLSIREANLATAQANVEAASAQLQKAALNLSFCRIVSPVAWHCDAAQRGDRQSRERSAATDDDRGDRRYVGDGEFQRDPTREDAGRPARESARGCAEEGFCRHGGGYSGDYRRAQQRASP